MLHGKSQKMQGANEPQPDAAGGTGAGYPAGVEKSSEDKSVYSFWLGRPVYLLDQPDGFQKEGGTQE